MGPQPSNRCARLASSKAPHFERSVDFHIHHPRSSRPRQLRGCSDFVWPPWRADRLTPVGSVVATTSGPGEPDALMPSNPYQTLGLEPGATTAEIKRATGVWPKPTIPIRRARPRSHASWRSTPRTRRSPATRHLAGAVPRNGAGLAGRPGSSTGGKGYLAYATRPAGAAGGPASGGRWSDTQSVWPGSGGAASGTKRRGRVRRR